MSKRSKSFSSFLPRKKRHLKKKHIYRKEFRAGRQIRDFKTLKVIGAMTKLSEL